jgi:SAM-dependent methyltransferase
VDVNASTIDWCQRHIAARHPGFQFTHLDLKNERYNPGGREIDTRARLPLSDGSLEIIYLYSVFSHMQTAGVSAYLEEFRRLLVPGGRVFLTAFVEPGVPDEQVNPPGYGPLKWSGPLHCVRFERGFIEGLVRAQGLRIDQLEHGVETDGQSGIYLTSPPGNEG